MEGNAEAESSHEAEESPEMLLWERSRVLREENAAALGGEWGDWLIVLAERLRRRGRNKRRGWPAKIDGGEMGLAEHAATPYLGMVLASTAQVGLIIISKSALASGMTNYTFVAYSNALAALILLPLSLLVHRWNTSLFSLSHFFSI
ncbi:hypothetical protein SASPL_130910 [Salvia splendens]|uniref:WAT1-related protein n=1 Tax=Salvia splendens TaxID=180675 RepID=A0A8X8X514_SALSN|nr:hypothetical protein SASPL_130910 [Salvia splendens]